MEIEMEIAGKRFKGRELTGEEAMLMAAVAVICIPSVREYLSKTIRLNLPEDKAFTILTFMGQDNKPARQYGQRRHYKAYP